MKVSKILGEIQKQTGNTIADLPRAAGTSIPDPEIEVQFDKTPFWTALDSVLDQAQLSIYPYGQPHALQIVPRGPHDRRELAGPTWKGQYGLNPYPTGQTRAAKFVAAGVATFP